MIPLYYGLTKEQMKAMRERVLVAITNLQAKKRTHVQELTLEGYQLILIDLNEGLKDTVQHG